MNAHATTTGMAVLLGLALVGGGAHAAQLARTHIKGVGESLNIINGSQLEQPFWQETIPQASGGMVTGDVIPFDQLGIDNAAVLRLLKLGGMDFGTTDFSRLAADDAHFEGCDLAGISLTVDDVRAACDAYRPVLDRLLQENWNAKLLFLSVAQPQVFWCRVPISGLADLQGKKVRVFNKAMVDFLDGVGAAAISMAFPEVFAALQRGVVDCAVTGALSGNTAGWGEVTTHQFPMSLGWAVRFTAVNLDSWERFDPQVRDFFVEQFAQQEEKAWALMKEATADADNCNTGKPSCTYGKQAHLTIVPISEEDRAAYKQIIEDNVLKGWAERCGAECAKEWNETVGKTVGLTAPVN